MIVHAAGALSAPRRGARPPRRPAPPRSDKERQRGDHAVWGPLGSNSVGILEDVGMRVKYAYDHVFDGSISNASVYKTIGSRIVRNSMDGINGTIFAYGVTSSGKTHTMMVRRWLQGVRCRGRGKSP